jgi:CXXX repeat radical SAM target protein
MKDEKKNKKQGELQSRREFFKKAAKNTLPIIGAIALSQIPFMSKASESKSQWGCQFGCTGSCQGTCISCVGGCTGTCRGGCAGTCMGTCAGWCLGYY